MREGEKPFPSSLSTEGGSGARGSKVGTTWTLTAHALSAKQMDFGLETSCQAAQGYCAQIQLSLCAEEMLFVISANHHPLGFQLPAQGNKAKSCTQPPGTAVRWTSHPRCSLFSSQACFRLLERDFYFSLTLSMQFYTKPFVSYLFLHPCKFQLRLQQLLILF